MSAATRHPCAGLGGLVLAAAALALAACGGGGVDTAAGPDTDSSVAGEASRSTELADVLRSSGLTSAATAVETVGLDALTDAEDYTIFVPTDAAFQSLGADEIADLLGDADELVAVLRNHVVPGRTTTAQLLEVDAVTTAGGMSLDVAGSSVGGASIVESDIEVGSSGLIHVVDRFLGP